MGAWRPLPLLSTAVAVSIVMFWPQPMRQIPDLQARPEYQIPWSELTVTPAGRWVPSDVISQIRRMSDLPDPLPVLDEKLAQHLATAFARHPWVANVRSVEKSSPRDIRVEVEYRQPMLMVRTKRGLYPVDRDGVLLPPSDFTLADAERFPRVVGVHSVPSGPAGTDWGDQAVRGAARLAELLTQTERRTTAWERFGVSAITILEPQRPADSLEEVLLGLRTRTGSLVEWGRPPGADDLEPTIDQKLRRLEKYLPGYGDPRWSGTPVRLDVWRWDVVNRHELSRDHRVGGTWR